MRNRFIELLMLKAIKNQNIQLLSGDIGFGVLDKWFEIIPKQILNVGIAEQNMTGVAAGLALEGYKVFTYSIGNFCSLRCLEQIRNDICYHNLDVKIISTGSGLGYGSLGMSHHATEDIGIMRSIPNIKIYSPSDYAETQAVIEDLVSTKGPGYVRLSKIQIGTKKERDAKVDLCNIVNRNVDSKIVLLTYGSTVELAKNIIQNINISCDLYTISRLKPLPEKNLKEILSKRTHIITLEEHNLCCGFGSAISEFIIDNNINIPIIRLGLHDEFLSICGNSNELRDYAKLSIDNCIKIINRNVH